MSSLFFVSVTFKVASSDVTKSSPPAREPNSSMVILDLTLSLFSRPSAGRSIMPDIDTPSSSCKKHTVCVYCSQVIRNMSRKHRKTQAEDLKRGESDRSLFYCRNYFPCAVSSKRNLLLNHQHHMNRYQSNSNPILSKFPDWSNRAMPLIA